MILDLFAGPGGWSEGLRILGARDVGIDNDRDACATRRAAGHATIRADVAALPLRLGDVDGLIASPPCTDFSLAGKRAGRTGASGQLIDLMPALVDRLSPRWVACEQVPPCIAIWREHALEYHRLGYRVWRGVLNAANFGVPQTRKRAFLLAARDFQPLPPEPTHSRIEVATLFGQRDRWVSMAEALGWGMTNRPAVTVVANSNRDGGMDALDGGAGSRRTLQRARDDGTWVYHRPSTTIVGSFRPDIVASPGWRKAGDRPRQDTPGSVRITVEQALVLQSFPEDYPLQGSITSRFQQVGNAVPPLLAARVLEQFVR